MFQLTHVIRTVRTNEFLVQNKTETIITIMIIKLKLSKLFRLNSKSKCSRNNSGNKSLKTFNRSFDKEYQIVSMVGKGGFGTVHKAIRKTDGEVVAVKIVAKDKVLSVEENNLPLEIALLRQVSDVPGVVKLLDYFETPTSYYIVMEMFKCCDLFDFISNCGTLSEEVAREIFRQIVETLTLCQENQVLHGDIKVKVTENVNWKLNLLYLIGNSIKNFKSFFRMKIS